MKQGLDLPVILCIYFLIVIPIEILSSCIIEDLQMYPNTNTRRVPPGTKVTVKCVTSTNCQHAYINTKQVKEPETELEECSPIDQNGVQTCNVTIMEPVEVICYGVHQGHCHCAEYNQTQDCQCTSSRSRSILIEIFTENSTADPEPHPTEKLPSINCSTTNGVNRTSSDSAILNPADVSLTIIIMLISLMLLL